MVRPVAQNWRAQDFDPLAALKQRIWSFCCFRPPEHVTKTRSPIIIGLDNPSPGKSAVQWISLLVFSADGMDVSAETPSLLGPRNWGQSAPGNAKTPPR